MSKKWEFTETIGDWSVRANYDNDNNVEFLLKNKLFHTITYPSYKIWNIAAHFEEYIPALEKERLEREGRTTITAHQLKYHELWSWLHGIKCAQRYMDDPGFLELHMKNVEATMANMREEIPGQPYYKIGTSDFSDVIKEVYGDKEQSA